MPGKHLTLRPDKPAGGGRGKMVAVGLAHPIGIGARLTTGPLPHHLAYGSVPRRFGWLNFGFRLQEQR